MAYPTSPYEDQRPPARPTRRHREALEKQREEYYRECGHSPERARSLARGDTIDAQLKRLGGG